MSVASFPNLTGAFTRYEIFCELISNGILRSGKMLCGVGASGGGGRLGKEREGRG